MVEVHVKQLKMNELRKCPDEVSLKIFNYWAKIKIIFEIMNELE
jgi:hypothetical protein